MNTQKTTAYFNNNTHKNNNKSWSSFRTLLEHLLQCDNEKNRDRFNQALAELSYVIYDNKKLNIRELTEENKLKIVQDLINHFDKNISDYENKNTDLNQNKEYKIFSHRVSTYKSKIKKQIKELELNDTEIKNINRILDKLNNNQEMNILGDFKDGQYFYSRELESTIPTELVRKNLVLLVQAHNEKIKIENGKKTKVRSGQGFATDTVFRIPLINNINFDSDFLEKSTVEFYEKYLPDFTTKLICIHQNEYFMSDEEIKNHKINGKTADEINLLIVENAKKTAHVQTVIDLFNHKDKQYNFTEKKIEAINNYIRDNKLEYDQLPTKGTLSKKQSSVLGIVFQKMFYDFINDRSPIIKLVKVENLDKKDITEERSFYLERKAKHKNIRLNRLNNNYNKNTSIKDSIFSAFSRMEEEDKAFKNLNTETLTKALKEKLTEELTPAITKELTPEIKNKLKEKITKEMEPKLKEETINKIQDEIDRRVPTVRKKLLEKKKLQLETEVQEELTLSKDKLITEENKKILLEYRQKNQDKIIKDIKKDIEAEERVKLANRDYNKYYILKAEFQTKLSLYPMIEDKYKKRLKDEFDNLIDRIRDAFKAAFNFFSQLEQGKEQGYIDNLENELNYSLNPPSSVNNTNKIQSSENKPKIKL